MIHFNLKNKNFQLNNNNDNNNTNGGKKNLKINLFIFVLNCENVK